MTSIAELRDLAITRLTDAGVATLQQRNLLIGRLQVLAAMGLAREQGNGTWTLLNSRSMVHYQTTPNPGQAGNVIIAFHREPDFQYINQLNVGDTITIQSRTCQTFVYRVIKRWDLPPNQVTQLGPTTGHELTMVTCDPWWQDYDRFVWRAELISAPAAGGATGGSVVNPSF